MTADEWRWLRILVVLLLVLQLVAVVFTWLLNPMASRTQSAYSLLLAADLVAFAMISYVARLGGRGEEVRGSYVLTGCAAACVLVVMVLLV
jgi:hypothetical protein